MLWTKYLTQTNKILIQKTSNIVLQKRTISKPVRRSSWEQKLGDSRPENLAVRRDNDQPGETADKVVAQLDSQQQQSACALVARQGEKVYATEQLECQQKQNAQELAARLNELVRAAAQLE